MSTALFLSPHLDDVAFSCGGTLATLARTGWRCVLLTSFTSSVSNPTGFALACQTDKGLPPEVDYLALRRAEDERAARRLGAAAVRWLDLPEAPHRGYHSAPALFAELLPTDTVADDLLALLQAELATWQPELLFAPQGLGQHVDHRRLMQAVQQLAGAPPVLWYRDTPYIIRQPEAQPAPELPAGLAEAAVPLDAAARQAKVHASQAYATQIGFQFGGAEQVETKLLALAQAEAARVGLGQPAERFAVAAQVLPDLPPEFARRQQLQSR